METWGQPVGISKRIKIALILALVVLLILGLVYLKNILAGLIFREYQRYWPAQIGGPGTTAVRDLLPKVMVKRLAESYGLDSGRVYGLAEFESQFDCQAKNPNSTAGGLFQFLDSTWISKRQQFGLDPDLNLKFDCYENARTAMLTLRAGEYHHWQDW